MRALAADWRQVSGPERFDLAPGGVVVCTPLWNAAYWLPEWLAHHRELGVAGFAICDTGSSDGTLDYLAQQPDVALFSTSLPFSYQNAMRALLAERFAHGGWALFSDSDELFDYAGSDRVPIERLTGHLAQHGFTGLPAVMVDLFPQGELGAHDASSFAAEIAAFGFYEWDTVQARAYRDPAVGFHRLLERNVLPEPAPALYWGGVRHRVFGEYACLSKMPLVKVAPGVLAGVHPHCAAGPVKLADFFGVIRHYKFSNHLFARDRATLEARRLSHDGDAKRLQVIEKLPQVVLHSPAARRFGDAAQFLAQEGFPRPAHLAGLPGEG